MEELTLEQAMQQIIELQGKVTEKETEIETFKNNLTEKDLSLDKLKQSNEMLQSINHTYYSQLNQQFKGETTQTETTNSDEVEVLSIDELVKIM